jgi:uncharacterized membrane protein SirB2
VDDLVKTVHQGAVALSFGGFFARGAGALAGAAWARGRLARTLPHIVDSVLLLSALWLVWRIRLNPLSAPWLVAKIAGLAAYIALGTLALRPGISTPARAAAWVGAMLVFAYIVAVAVTKDPAGPWLLRPR